MNKRLIFLRNLHHCWIAALLVTPSFLQAQTPDSLIVRRAAWKTQSLSKGLQWRESQFDTLFSSRQHINFIRFKNKRRKPTVAFASAGDSLKPTSWFGKRDGALVALNGTFFDTKKGGSVDYIKIDGHVFDTTRAELGKNRSEHQQAAITIHKNRLQIRFGGTAPQWDQQLAEKNVMVTGPLLLQNGKPHPLAKNAFNDNRHPRTCLCTTPNREVLLVAVDGRNANAQGMNLHELTALMRWLGCRDAINLDGGGSTTLWIQGIPDNGVVNYPSDNKKWDHFGERPVSNVLLLK